MKNGEILAPASSLEMAQFAIRNGANSVYLGLQEFNARRNAQNFTLDELKLLIEFSHIRGVSIYLTFNILIKNSEIEKALKTLDDAISCGIDGVIVQDLGIARLLKKRYPTLKLHASTQLSIHNIEGVKMLEEIGFSRVCLARELSLDEIKKIRKNTNMELEVFVHGAHCMSMSGQCYFSSLIGSRSGNRGLCGQICRLPFKNGTSTHSLSLKDLSIIDSLPLLKDLGINAFKIEGRMKRPEYVKMAVRACKKSLSKSPDFNDEYSKLKDVFSRSGFTRGYFDNKRDADMFGIRTKEDIASEKLLKEIRNSEKENPLIGVEIYYSIKENQKIKLTLDDGKNKIAVESDDAPQKAEKKAITKIDAEENLSKFGGTPYFCTNIEGFLDDGLFVSKSTLNNLRRLATEKLSEKRCELNIPKCTDFTEDSESKIRNKTDKKDLILSFESSSNIPEDIKNYDISELYLSIFSPIDDFKTLLSKGLKVGVMLPEISFSNMDSLKSKLEKLKEIGVDRALCNNLYAIKLARDYNLKILAGSGLNIMNNYSAKEIFDLGADKICLSFEMSKKEINTFKSTQKIGIIAYGYLPLMLTRACPLSHLGCGRCKDDRFFTDRLNNKFELLCKGEYQKLLNSVPLSVAGEENDFAVDFLLFNFTTEKKDRVDEVLSAYKNGKNPKNEGFTRGLYNRGVM